MELKAITKLQILKCGLVFKFGTHGWNSYLTTQTSDLKKKNCSV